MCSSDLAHLILNGAVPERVLLLTFTRRAAAEMTRRAQRILAAARGAQRLRGPGATGELSWSGTFHAIGNRLLREHADSIGLDPRCASVFVLPVPAPAIIQPKVDHVMLLYERIGDISGTLTCESEVRWRVGDQEARADRQCG